MSRGLAAEAWVLVEEVGVEAEAAVAAVEAGTGRGLQRNRMPIQAGSRQSCGGIIASSATVSHATAGSAIVGSAIVRSDIVSIVS